MSARRHLLIATALLGWVPMILLSAAVTMRAGAAGAETGGGIDNRGAREVEARGPGGTRVRRPVRRRPACFLEGPPGAKYRPWMRRLICRYITTNFATDRAKRGYVFQAFDQLRLHGIGAGRVPVSTRESIARLVTNNPGYGQIKATRGGFTFTPRKITKAVARRAWRRNSRNQANVGINLNAYFPSGRTTDDKRGARKAETLLLVLVGVAKHADLIHTNPTGLSKARATASVTAAMRTFRKRLLVQRPAPPKPNIDGIAARNAVPTPAARRRARHTMPTQVSAYRITPDGRSKKKAADIKPGQIMGITLPINGLRPVDIRRKSYVPEDVDSVEPYPKLQKGIIVRAVVRTNLSAVVIYGHVSRRAVATAKKQLFRARIAVFQVTDRAGRPCTAKIRTHEERHVSDTWRAWSEKVLPQVPRLLDDRHMAAADKTKMKGYLKRDTYFRVRRSGVGGRIVYVDFHADYYYPGKNRETRAGRAAKVLKRRGSRAALDVLRKRFNVRNKALAKIFHKSWEGLGPDCQPLAAGKGGAKLGGLEPGRREITAPPPR